MLRLVEFGTTEETEMNVLATTPQCDSLIPTPDRIKEQIQAEWEWERREKKRVQSEANARVRLLRSLLRLSEKAKQISRTTGAA